MTTSHRAGIISLTLLTVLLFVTACTKPEPPAVPGNPAPAFSLADVNGKPLRLADLAGSVVVLDFWATWCGPCKKAVRELEVIHRTYGSRGVVVIGISVDTEKDAAATVRDFAAKNGMTYLLALDDGSVKRRYGVVRIPATYIIGRDRTIRETYPGYQEGLGKRISADVEKLL
jgi:peroxiredoxin